MEIKAYFKNNQTLILLIGILLLSSLLRVYSLDKENFWPDEAVTVYNSHKTVYDNILWSFNFAYFPLYHVMLSSWEKLAGLSEFSMRIPSAIFGAFSVFLVYQISSLLFNRKVGLYSSIIMALSPFNLYYSQEARVYTFFLFFSLLSIYTYILYFKSNSRKNLFYYLFSSLMIILSHAASIFILVFQNVHYILFIRKKFKEWVLAQIFLLICFLPLLFFTLTRVSELSRHLAISKPDIVALARTFFEFSAGNLYTPAALYLGGTISLIFAFLLLCSIFKMKSHLSEDNYPIKESSLVWLWLILPIFLAVTQSYLLNSFYFDRYVIFSSAAMYIIISVQISFFREFQQAVLLAAIILISLGLAYLDFTSFDKGHWQDAADYVRFNKAGKDIVVLHIPNSVYSFMYYYDPDCFRDSELLKCAAKQNIYAVLKADDLPPNTETSEKAFLVLFNEKYIDKDGTLLRYFNRTGNYIQKDFRHIKIFTFLKPID